MNEVFCHDLWDLIILLPWQDTLHVKETLGSTLMSAPTIAVKQKDIYMRPDDTSQHTQKLHFVQPNSGAAPSHK